MFLDLYKSVSIQEDLSFSSKSIKSSPILFLLIASNALSAASIPDFMAVCVPLIFVKTIKPASQPTKIPPGKVIFGLEW